MKIILFVAIVLRIMLEYFFVDVTGMENFET
jgi:hypothetical protein